MKIRNDNMGWYKITTHRNIGEKKARNFIINNLPIKTFIRSLIAQGNTAETAKWIVDNIQKQAKTPYGVLAFNGYILVKAY